MATQGTLFSSILWAGVATHAVAATLALPSDISGLVPPCALYCFQSFVSSNYGASGCASSPSLPCLCQRTGTSGFTLGEGGVQCLVAEISRGSCRGGDASQQAVSQVYAMCSGVQNAAPQTHATIIATLVVPSGTGPVQVPTGLSTTTTLAPASTSIHTSSTLNIAPTTPLATTSTIASPSSTVPGASSGDSSIPANTSRTGPPLNTAQVVGISIGIAATLGFAVGLIFLARCIRQRNIGDQESVLFQPKRESKGFGMLKSSQNSPQALHISAPIHKAPMDMSFRRPGDFPGSMAARAGPIGLALSPPRTAAATVQAQRVPDSTSFNQPSRTYMPYRPNGQGLPKPTLALSIPRNLEEPQRDVRTVQSSRDSVMTEFQEDGEAESVEGSNIWRPPTDPQSTTTYYVADKWGNWILRDSDARMAEVPTAMETTELEQDPRAAAGPWVDRTLSSRGERQLSQAIQVPNKTYMSRLGPPIEFQEQRSSSAYSSFGPPQPVAAGDWRPLPGLPSVAPVMPIRQGNATPTESHDLAKRRRSNHGKKQNKRKSRNPVLVSTSPVADEHQGRGVGDYHLQEGLSPVVESPHATTSSVTSPFGYSQYLPETRAIPEQQGRRQVPAAPKAPQPTLSLFPRTAENGTVDPLARSLSEQPSPTLGVVDVSAARPQRGSLAAQPVGSTKQHFARGPSLNPNPLRYPAKFSTGSPEMRSGSAPIESQRQRRQSPLQQRHHHHRRGSSLEYDHFDYQQSSQPDLYPGHGQEDFGSSGNTEHLGPIGLPERIFISRASATTNGSADSTGSSYLLTKRLGADRAAALTLGEDFGSQSARRVKWQRDQQGPGVAGQDAGIDLPATPGWLPKLTPTRRGEDLFLNVQ